MKFAVSSWSIGYLDRRNPPVSESRRQKSIRDGTHLVREASMVGLAVGYDLQRGEDLSEFGT